MISLALTRCQTLVFEDAEDGVTLVNQHAYHVAVGGELDVFRYNSFAFVKSALSSKHYLGKRALNEAARRKSESQYEVMRLKMESMLMTRQTRLD